MRPLPLRRMPWFRAAAMAALALMVVSGCGDDDISNLFPIIPPVDAGDASLTPDHAGEPSSDGGSSSMEGSADDRSEPSDASEEADAALPVEEMAEDTGT